MKKTFSSILWVPNIKTSVKDCFCQHSFQAAHSFENNYSEEYNLHRIKGKES